MSVNPIVQATALRKRYATREALAGVSLEVNAGEVVGLLGPNGAGKTTTLSLLSGIIRADAGHVTICGQDLDHAPRLARQKLGLVPQSLALYPTLTAMENLEFFGRIQGLTGHDARERALALLSQVGLLDRMNEPVSDYSGGMKRRLNLACGMIHQPTALLLDEPAVGVDPQSRGRIFTVIEDVAKKGAAVLYSTHYMDEVERLCSRVILIDHGRIAAKGSIPELIERAGAELRLEVKTRDRLNAGWASGVNGVRELPGGLEDGVGAALALTAVDRVPDVIRCAELAGGQVVEFHLHRPNLQDAFLALTGHGLRDSV
ncbi:MAG TPA: ABC transporter ATP-binding protein [Candidatus Binataceae bacterium]